MLLRAQICDSTEAELLRQNIGKKITVNGGKCIIVNVVRIKGKPGHYNITIRKLK
jgi:hypothetical protein